MSEWEVISAIARAILTMSVVGGVIALMLMAIKPLIKDRLPKSAQYYLWVIALVPLLVPFSLFFSIPVKTPITPVREIIEANVKTTVEWREEIALEQYNAPFEELEPEEKIKLTANVNGYVKGDIIDYLVEAPAIPGIFAFLMGVVRYFIFVWKLRRARLPAKDSETAALRELCKPGATARLYRNPLTPTPMLVGAFRPVIYLPDAEYSKAQLQNILLHELTHLRRRDVAVKWLAELAFHIHWFNPATWLMRRELQRACELACDEAVIKYLDPDGRQSYGDTLIAMASDGKAPRIIAATTMCETKKTLKERLGAIMKYKKSTRLTVALSAALLAATVLTACTLGSGTVLKNSGSGAPYSSDETFLSTAVKSLDNGVTVSVAYCYDEQVGAVKALVDIHDPEHDPRLQGGSFEGRDAEHWIERVIGKKGYDAWSEQTGAPLIGDLLTSGKYRYIHNDGYSVVTEQGKPGKGDISLETAISIGFEALVNKYSLEPERFAASATLYTVSGNVHWPTWLVSLNPARVGIDFVEDIGAYTAILDSRTGGILDMYSHEYGHG